MASCGNDLQSYIAFLKQRHEKLVFLKSSLAQKELVHLFLRPAPGLSMIEMADRQPDTLDSAIDLVRKYAGKPAVLAELTKLRASMPQSIFTSVPAPTKEKQVCFRFARGKCDQGDKCRLACSRAEGARKSHVFSLRY